MKNYKAIILLSSFCLLTSCRTTRQVVKTTNKIQKEVSESRVSYRDTVLYTSKAQTSLKLPVSEFKKCSDELFKQPFNGVKEPSKQPRIFTQKNGNAKAIVRIEHDTITVTAECDSLALRAQIKSEFESKERFDSSLESQSEKEERKSNFFMIAGLCVVFFFAGFIVKSLIKISI
ncbi:hypothetical protein OMO38_10300 [Chryseobacterium sp. 09-1422]|uniref:Lipoprotein n=1 Tax=Chryseobacterium kimseyorum TaxID=2984028 RepID=A0ABT3HYQ8_9FLAO|nr:hypothetical protein [Chryseobacterium kimseyorum]MCW3168912.1 hypothetical protein [Chryseobacterium kimseyorum]